jgi:hypothetical protein
LEHAVTRKNVHPPKDDDIPAEIDFSRMGPPAVGKYHARAMQRDDLRPEYHPDDFAGLRGERGKYAKALRRDSAMKVRKTKSTGAKRGR